MHSILEKYTNDTFGKDANESFYDLSSAEQELIFDEINRYATSDPEKFKREVKTLEFEAMSPLCLIYEALAGDPENWGNFLADEVDRLFSAAKTHPKPKDVLDNLTELCFNLETGNFPHIQRLVKFMGSQLDDQKPVIRFEAINLLSHFLDDENHKKHPAVVSKLVETLSNDPNWRVRFMAKITLRDINSLPEGYQTGFWDKIRAKIFSPFSI